MFIGDKDFYQQINDNFRLTTVYITYRMPDYLSILQEYIWQTLDRPPEYHKIYKFLDYWQKNLQGPIYSVKIAHTDVITPIKINNVSEIFNIKK